MITPPINARVEKPHEFTGFPVDRTDVSAFGLVAAYASKSEVLGVRLPAVFLANDVIKLTTEECVFFANQAIFAKTFGSRYNQPPEICIDIR